MFLGLGLYALFRRYNEQHGINTSRSSKHFSDKRSVAWNVDETQPQR
jgi:hypothetical protein